MVRCEEVGHGLVHETPSSRTGFLRGVSFDKERVKRFDNLLGDATGDTCEFCQDICSQWVLSGQDSSDDSLAIVDFFDRVALEQMPQPGVIVVIVVIVTEVRWCLEKTLEPILASIMVDESTEKGCNDEEAINLDVQLLESLLPGQD